MKHLLIYPPKMGPTAGYTHWEYDDETGRARWTDLMGREERSFSTLDEMLAKGWRRFNDSDQEMDIGL